MLPLPNEKAIAVNYIKKAVELLEPDELLIELTMAGILVTDDQTEMITIGDLMHEYLEEAKQTLAESSFQTFEGILSKLEEHLKQTQNLEEDATNVLHGTVLSDFFNSLEIRDRKKSSGDGRRKKTNHDRTKDKYRSAIRSLFRYGRERGYFKVEWWPACLKSTSKSRQVPRSLSQATINEIFRGLQDTRYSVQYRTLVKFLLGTGARIGEAVGIQLSDIRWRSNTITVFGKYHPRGRTLYMTPTVRQCIRDYVQMKYPGVLGTFRERNSGLYLFSATSGEKPLSVRSIEEVLSRLAHNPKLHIKDDERDLITPHGMRHTYARTLIDQDVDIVTVMALLGHANISSTQIYTEPRVEHLRHAAKKLDNFFDGKW